MYNTISCVTTDNSNAYTSGFVFRTTADDESFENLINEAEKELDATTGYSLRVGPYNGL